MKSCDLWEGDIVEFHYNGGSNPGSKRVVYVLSGSTDKNITTWDFDKQELRSFTRSKMTDIRFLDDEEYKIVDLNSLPQTISARGIQHDFEAEGYKVYVGDDEVIAVQPKDINLLRGYYCGKIFFDVNNHNVGLEVIDKSVRLLVDNQVYEPATVEDLARVFNS